MSEGPFLDLPSIRTKPLYHIGCHRNGLVLVEACWNFVRREPDGLQSYGSLVARLENAVDDAKNGDTRPVTSGEDLARSAEEAQSAVGSQAVRA